MLPLELLKVIFGALSRDDLDVLMLTSTLFHDMVLRDFASEPFRYFATLYIWEHESSRFELTTGNTYDCEDNDDFNRRLRLGRVGVLE
ncbi:hypothetical protein AAVH_16928 [Aphelenchoides avenae]|nr:hypothetical protein AAVH_16928 [Aphelenchus avenae]